MNTAKELVAYIRVSTNHQGEFGLGMAAQVQIVKRYAKSVGARIIKWYREVESGRKSKRPKLRRAIRRSRTTGATLVIAKLDRLSRDVYFTSLLMKAGVKFVCCDMPNADETTIHIFAALAQREAMLTSQRTKDALAELKQKGKKLGAANPKIAAALEGKRGWRKANQVSARIRAKRCRRHYGELIPLVTHLRQSMSWEQITAYLNERNYKNAQGKPWVTSTVHRVFSSLAV